MRADQMVPHGLTLPLTGDNPSGFPLQTVGADVERTWLCHLCFETEAHRLYCEGDGVALDFATQAGAGGSVVTGRINITSTG